MEDFFLTISVVMAFVVSVPLFRVINGPTVYDRVIGANAFGSKTLVFILLIGYLYDRASMFVDITLAYAVLSFIGTLATARYLLDKHEDK